MDEYYSNLTVPDDADNEEIFKTHVVRDAQELEHIDNLLKSVFSEIDE
ncbi:MAG: hypothetical protein R3Y51_08490 [Rikenellaceae bacterium]